MTCEKFWIIQERLSIKLQRKVHYSAFDLSTNYLYLLKHCCMKKNFTLFTLIIVCFFKTITATAQVNVQDSLALVDFYNSTNGPNWMTDSKWLTSAPVSTWFGITVINNRVTEMLLGGLGEEGPIPSSIGNLTALRRFSAQYGITGTLPSTIGNCTALESLAIFFCDELNGPLPSTLGNLTNLQYLYLFSDSISGTIPSSLGNLSKLRWLYLAGNQLTGSIPASFNNLTSVDTFDVSFNQLSGTVPDLSALKNLKFFQLRNNNFTFNGMESIASGYPFAEYQYQGNIPIHSNNNTLSVSAGGTLANNTYKWYKGSLLAATTNSDSTYTATEQGYYHVEITNSIATGLTLISDSVYIDFNTLNTDSLALVDFYNSTNGPNWNTNNWLTSAPVSTWSGVTVSNNRVTEILIGNIGVFGPIPSSFGNLTALKRFSANYGITGQLPSSIGNLVSLESLALFWCDSLTGPIPSSLGNLSNLQYLYLYSDGLSGVIPSSLGNLSKLRWLILAGNQLTGNIPPSLNNLLSLDTLDLSFNQLSGTVPGLTQLNSLNILSLRNNRFTFAGIEQLTNYFPFAEYSPQAIIPLHKKNNVLSVSAGGYLPYLTFSWYKDGSLYKTITGDSTLPVIENGNYSVEVKDAYATQLTLYSDTINVNGVLAIKNLSLAITKQNNNIMLQWTTADEVNTDYFDVERSSDNVHFVLIGKVKASGSSLKNAYSFVDNLSSINIQSPFIYYRLKIVDKDGAYNYSGIKSVAWKDNLIAKLYPNPTTENVTLSFSATGKYALVVHDALGKTLQTLSGISNDSNNIIQLNVSKYASGIYLITICDEKNRRQILRLNKE